MRYAMPAMFVALLCAGCDKAHEPHPDVKSVPQVLAVYKAFEEAWEKEDLEAAVAHFERTAVVFDPVPPGRFEHIEAIRGWIEGSFEALDDIAIETSNMRLHAAGPAAWLTAHYVFTAKQGGQPARYEGDLTMNLLLLDDGAWKILVFHASHVPPAPPTEAPATRS